MVIAAPRHADAAALQRRILSRDARVGILGLGYAGLPLAIECARAGFTTLGFDVDEGKVGEINAGRSPVSSVEHTAVRPLVDRGGLVAASDFRRLETVDCVIVCVPTPLSAEQTPDTSYVERAIGTLAAQLAPRSLVVLQSSCYPGCTREVALPVLEAGGFQAGRDFYLAYAPERVDPGNRRYGVKNTPKLVGGVTPTCTDVASTFFRQIVETVVPVQSPEVAELAKLVENTFRFINISFVNEIAILCDRLGLNPWEVIQAASTKPFAFLPHYPGPGVGGDCIPVMPRYLEWCAHRADLPIETIAAANHVNRRMPEFVVEKLARLLRERQDRSLPESRVLVVGVSYKPNLADLRHAPSLRIIAQLRALGVQASYHDPLISRIDVAGAEMISTDLDQAGSFDAVLLVTPHQGIDYEALISRSALILDTQHALRDWSAPNVVHL